MDGGEGGLGWREEGEKPNEKIFFFFLFDFIFLFQQTLKAGFVLEPNHHPISLEIIANNIKPKEQKKMKEKNN